jgi:hypothetical protein
MITTPAGVKARTIKMTAELENARTIEKLEIERRYWAKLGIDWKIVTENEISRQKAKNIEWLYTAEGFDLAGRNEYELERIRCAMLNLLRLGDNSIIVTSRMVENDFLLPAGAGLQIFKQLVLEKKLTIDLSLPINMNAKVVAA